MVEKTKSYFQKKQFNILVLLIFGVILLVLREVPFLNIFFPENTTLSIFVVIFVAVLRLYKNYYFLLFLALILLLLHLLDLFIQAEQLAIITFVILVLLIIDETISFFKEK